MKARTFLELMSISTNLYVLSKDEELMSKLKGYMEKGKDKINEFVSEPIVDEDGNELEFVDKLIKKAHEAREDLNTKIEEIVTSLYHKMNIAHTDQINELQIKIEQLSKELAIAEARINHLDKNLEK